MAIAQGGVGFDGSPGTGSPPAKLHGYKMKKFQADRRPTSTNVTYVSGPTGKVKFNQPVKHAKIGHGWTSWSHGYMGSVYFTNQSNKVTMTLPHGTDAFYFYAEPNSFGTFDITATADGISSGPVAVHDTTTVGGAKYFGFYARDKGAAVTQVTVKITGEKGIGRGFAVGEFGIN